MDTSEKNEENLKNYSATVISIIRKFGKILMDIFWVYDNKKTI